MKLCKWDAKAQLVTRPFERDNFLNVHLWTGPCRSLPTRWRIGRLHQSEGTAGRGTYRPIGRSMAPDISIQYFFGASSFFNSSADGYSRYFRTTTNELANLIPYCLFNFCAWNNPISRKFSMISSLSSTQSEPWISLAPWFLLQVRDNWRPVPTNQRKSINQ